MRGSKQRWEQDFSRWKEDGVPPSHEKAETEGKRSWDGDWKRSEEQVRSGDLDVPVGHGMNKTARPLQLKHTSTGPLKPQKSHGAAARRAALIYSN